MIDARDKKFLVAMLIAIFVSRFILSVFVMQARGGELSQDEGLYSKKALLLSFQIKGYKDIEKHFADYFVNDYDMLQKDYGFNIYTRLLAGFYYVFGYQIQAARLINAVIFMIAFLLIFYVAKTVFDPKIARMASVVFAFFPSLLLWSSMICVDITIIACAAAFILFMIKFIKAKIGLAYFGLMMLSIIAVRSIRPYIANLLVAFAALSFFYKAYILAYRRYGIAVLSVVVAVLILAGINSGASHFLKLKFDGVIREMIQNQEGFAVADDSSYVIYPTNCYVTKSCSLSEFAAAYARGMGYAVLSPFPWRIDSRLQLMACPQVIIWYVMLPFILYGFYLGFRSNGAVTVFIFLYCLCVLSVMALAEGNVGALFRHRDMVTPFCIIYFAAGFEWIRQRYFT